MWKGTLLPAYLIRNPVAAGRLVASLAMAGVLALAASWAKGLLDDQSRLAVLIGTAGSVSLALYIVTLLLFRDPEVRGVLRWAWSRRTARSG